MLRPRMAHWLTGLRGRLIVLLLVALLPAIGLLLFQGLQRRRDGAAERQAHALNMARLAAQAQERRIEGARQLLIALSANPAIRSHNADECVQAVRRLVTEYQGLYAEIGWADNGGRIMCHALEGPPNLSIADREYFQRVLQTGTFAVGELIFGKIRGVPVLAFAYPLRDSAGAVSGVLFANVDLREFSDSLVAAARENGATISVLDRAGALLARSADAEQFIGTRTSREQLQLMNTEGDMVRAFIGPDGTARLYAIATVRDVAGEPAMFVTFGLPQDTFMAVIASRFRDDLITILVFGIGMIIAAWIGVERLVRRPINRLVVATRALAAGRLDTRAERISGTQEFDALASAFNRMAEKLEQRDVHLRQGQRLEAIGQLAGGIAHDFNNILTVILGYSASLQEQLPDGTPLAEELAELRTAAERAASLTQQLLAFSRRQLLVPKPLQLNDIVEQMRTMLTRTIGSTISLDVRLDPELGIVRADPAQIEQVILNLAINARDAMPDGGLIRIATHNRVLDGDACPPGTAAGAYVELSIEDSGIGMDADTRARIFEPFFTTKGTSGTGLGLATVYGIVKQSEGWIECDSTPGQGSRFAVLLPRSEGTVESRADRTADVPARGSERILVVEDERAVRDLVLTALSRRGYALQSAEDGAAALAWIRTGAPLDLVVTDVRMPGMSGIALYHHVRNLRPGVPTLLISGDSAPSVVDAPPGVAPLFLQKPFTTEELARAVRAALSSRDSGPEWAAHTTSATANRTAGATEGG